VQSDTHGDEVVDVLLVQFIGVAVAELDPFAEASFGNGLPGQCQARGIELQPDDLPIGEAFGVVRDVVATAGADVEHIAALLQLFERFWGLGQDVLGKHDAVRLRRVLECLDEEGIMVAAGPYTARAQVLGESSVVLVKGSVELYAPPL
jgi:hypothetical protein